MEEIAAIRALEDSGLEGLRTRKDRKSAAGAAHG